MVLIPSARRRLLKPTLHRFNNHFRVTSETFDNCSARRSLFPPNESMWGFLSHRVFNEASKDRRSRCAYQPSTPGHGWGESPGHGFANTWSKPRVPQERERPIPLKSRCASLCSQPGGARVCTTALFAPLTVDCYSNGALCRDDLGLNSNSVKRRTVPSDLHETQSCWRVMPPPMARAVPLRII